MGFKLRFNVSIFLLLILNVTLENLVFPATCLFLATTTTFFFYAYSPQLPPFQSNSTHARQPPDLDVESCRNAFLKMTDNLHSVDATLDPAPIPKFLSKKCKKKNN